MQINISQFVSQPPIFSVIVKKVGISTLKNEKKLNMKHNFGLVIIYWFQKDFGSDLSVGLAMLVMFYYYDINM